MMYTQSLAFSYFAYRQEPHRKVVTTSQELEQMMNALRPARAIAFDYETNGLAWWKGRRPCGVAFATRGPSDPHTLSWYVPFRHLTGQLQLPPETVLAVQKELLENPEQLHIAHNIKFEQHMSREDGITLRGPRVDTMIEGRLYKEDQPSGLKGRMTMDLGDSGGELAESMLKSDVHRLAKFHGMGVEEYMDECGYAEMEIYLAGLYASYDAQGTWDLHEHYEKQGVRNYYSKSPRGPQYRGIYDIEMKLTDVLCKMEHVGQPLDVEYLKNLHIFLMDEKAKAEAEFFKAMYHKTEYFNLSSDDQLREFLQKGLKLKWEKTTASGNPAVDADVLDELSTKVPELAHVLRFKEVEKKLSTYTLALIAQADSNGVLHCNFQQVGTNCMPAGELVLTSRGYLPVQNVSVGDLVLTHKEQPRRVIETNHFPAAPIYRVTLDNGLSLRTTGNHAYLTPSGWVEAKDLKPGLEVVTHSEPEEWKKVPDWEDFSVSSWGRVQNDKTGYMLTQKPKGRWGHLKVCLYRNGAQKRGPDRKDVPVHRLVASAFVQKVLPEHVEVRHLNGISWDNTVDNLAWGTSTENKADAISHGMMSRRNSHVAKLSEEAVADIRSTPFVRAEARLGRLGSDRTLAARYGVSRELIRDVRLGLRWNPEAPVVRPSVLCPVTVHSVEVEEAQASFGLTVEEDHSHVTGGIVTHNTGRLACREPNLQNTSSDDEKRAKANGGQDPESIKRAFRVQRPEGDAYYRFLMDKMGKKPKLYRQFWDYSQIELRVLAEYTQDKRLVQAYLDDKDIHDEVEMAVFGTNKKMGGPNRRKAKCFHPDTEVLTKAGWKKILDLAQGEEVVQAIPADGFKVRLEWVVPTEVFSKPNHSDRLVHLYNEGMDLRVTPDHRMLVWGTGNGKLEPFKVVTPYAVSKQRGWMNAGEMSAGSLMVDEKLLRLAVALQADGSLRPAGALTFGFSKDRKKERLRMLLNGRQFTETTKGRVTTFYIPHAEDIRALLTEGKEFPWSWLELTPALREVVLDEVQHWDSCTQPNWRMVRYTSVSNQSLDLLQALASISNRKTRKALITDKDHAWNLTIRDKPSSRGGSLSLEEIPYSGEVSCLSVPSTFVLVRDGKAKVPVVVGQTINFGLCVAEGQNVLTKQSGLIPIEEIKDWHLVWDGLDWVSHDGLVCRGEKEVILYDGLWATPEHEVFTQDGRKLPIRDLALSLRGGRLAIGEVAGHAVGYSDFDRRHREESPEHEILRGHVLGVQEDSLASFLERLFWQDHQLPLSERQVQGSSGSYLGRALRRYGAALRAGYTRIVAQLQGARDQGTLHGPGALCSVGSGNMAGHGFQGSRLRPYGQRWPLQSRKPPTGGQNHQPHESKTVRVYDLLNAGPRHRFTVAGKVVSNSYCMSPIGFARQIKEVTEEEAQGYFDEYNRKFPGVPAFRNKFWAFVRMNGCQFDSKFGRTRHCPGLTSGDRSEQKRNERMAIATLIQGTAAELTKQSLVLLDEWLEGGGFSSRMTLTIHDEVQLDGPVEEFAAVSRATKRIMEDFPDFSVPIKVEGKWSVTHWMDKKDLHIK